ncbi:MAG: substrate-binding domain-containing protein, partial [Clostridia bacterium]|nr:substrate-binding domain-containing protein [Clostridia bacterium]
MKYTYAALVLAVLLLVGMLVNLYVSFHDETAAVAPERTPLHHFVIITQENNDPFWQRFKNGAREAAAKNDVFAEFVDISQKDAELSKKAVERAILSDVDGIALQPYDIQKTSDVLEKANKAGISVITFENDTFFIPSIPTVGSNSYEIGYNTGEMAIQASGGKAKIAILSNQASDEDSKHSSNIRLQGLMEAIEKYPEMSVEHIYTLNTQMFEVEKLTNTILTDNPDINMIICSDSESTPGVAQVIVDSDRVGQIKIIGSGTMPLTMRYIEGGVIYGTIAADSYAIGYNTVMQLSDMAEG